MAGRHIATLGAKATRFTDRHRRSHSPSTSFVRCRSHHASPPETSHDHRHPDQRRISLALDLHKEGIHVDVKKPLREYAHPPTVHTCSGLRRCARIATVRVHLIRHGEVENPDHVVYADLPGFTLSEVGLRQAAHVAQRLRDLPLEAIVSSPLQRAVDTATPIADANGGVLEVDQRLTEWLLSGRWAGVRWEDLTHRFPGELEAYLADPLNMDFAPETLPELAVRIATAITEWATAASGDVAVISHQDPIHAAHRFMTGAGFDDYHDDKPEHCSITTLQHDGSGWVTSGYWVPSL